MLGKNNLGNSFTGNVSIWRKLSPDFFGSESMNPRVSGLLSGFLFMLSKELAAAIMSVIGWVS